MNVIETVSPETIISSGRHAFIKASAGSGKTTLLTTLFAGIIAAGRAEVGQILCVTFTEKAASELKAKVYRALLANAENSHCRRAAANFAENQIGTIHSFCLRSLALAPLARLNELATDSNGDEEIFEQAREWVYRVCWAELDTRILARLLAEVKFGAGGRERQFDKELRQKALWCFATGSTPIVPLVENKSDVTDKVSFKAWTLYLIVHRMREISAQRNQMTFSRMVTDLAEALTDANLVKKIRSLFRYALIDEFQDTDQVQWNIFKQLFLSEEGNTKLIVVGDPKQAIYKFRGADVFVYLAARQEMQKKKAIISQLGVNYRSSPELLKFQNHVFSGKEPAAFWGKAEIHYHEPKCGRADHPPVPGAAVEIFTAAEYRADLLASFAAAAVERIRQWRSDNPEWTCAVIAYRHSSLEVFAQALRRTGMDFSYYRQQADFRRTEVMHLKVLLHSLTLNYEEGRALAELTLFLKDRADASSWYERLRQFAQDGRIVSLLTLIAQDTHLLHRMLECGGDATHYHAWRTLIQTLLLSCGSTVRDIDSLLQYLQSLEAGDDDNPVATDILREKSAVTLLTVQSSKGLDWNVVIVADGHNDNRWADFAFFHDASGRAVVPADKEDFTKHGNYQLEPETEARITQLNLLYVALTRAKDRLVLFSAPNSKSQKPGPVAFFLKDIANTALPEGCAVKVLQQIETAAPEPDALVIGEPPPVDHGDIAIRYGERTSFTALSNARFGETEFIEDILPRGPETGQLLHNLLENADFTALVNTDSPYSVAIRQQILGEVNAQFTETMALAEQIAARIFSILHATATAGLPLVGGSYIRLCDIASDKLWREMPFWSSAQIHQVLRRKPDTTRHVMHGYMDLVFTTDGNDFYILDYKSNSLSGVDPALIDKYVEEHYALQAQIYAEALAAYLQQYYPKTLCRVAGCHFVFLRYLAPNSTTGVHFIDVNALKE